MDSVDREKKDNYLLRVIAQDGGTPSLRGETILNVTILDVSDTAPYFYPNTAEIDVWENETLGKIIFTVSAKDDDLNDTLIYRMSFLSVSESVFVIDETTGEIKLNKSLDRETVSSYTIHIQAIDSNNLNTSLDGMVLKIKILDINDNIPIFVNQICSNDVIENTPNNNTILTVLATDADIGTNQQLVYSFDGKQPSLLKIDPHRGLISKAGVFDTQVQEFLHFSVRASDRGVPRLSNIINCTINIVDINDNNPQFNQSYYKFTTPENVPIGSFVGMVIATEKDVGMNAAIRYYLVGGQGKVDINITTVSCLYSNESLDINYCCPQGHSR